ETVTVAICWPAVLCGSASALLCFFFFQAEDGIRAFHVTGVQTCALPISFLYLIRRQAVVCEGEGVARTSSPPRFARGRRRFETRSEERRVGKECRSRWSPGH